MLQCNLDTFWLNRCGLHQWQRTELSIGRSHFKSILLLNHKIIVGTCEFTEVALKCVRQGMSGSIARDFREFPQTPSSLAHHTRLQSDDS